MNPPPRPPEGPPNPWMGRIGFAFVLATLVALVAVPIVVQERVSDLRERIESAEPARTLVTRLQYNLVREMSSLSELLLSGDTAYSATFATARSDEETLYRELAPLAADLGPAVVRSFAEARARVERWHAGVAHEEIVRRPATPEARDVPRERATFEDALRATLALDSVIVQTTAETQDRIRVAERTGLAVTFLLGLLALLAGIVVAMLDARVRRAAEVAERRRREAEEALAAAARAGEARGRLLRGITHDVKNPLGAAKGYAELLAMGVKAPMLPAQAPLVEGIQRSVDGALAIIADLLDIARADSGGLAIHCLPTDLVELTLETAEDHRAAAEAAGHEIHVERPDRPIRVHTDPVRVGQVLGNLLSNAIKYTPPPGRVTIRTERVDGDGAPREGRWVAVRVTDTGPGIPPGMGEAIFDEFTRLEDGGHLKGHGLGLAIARRVARLLGGDLTVSDTGGPGATFVLWLPRAEGPADATG